MGEDMEVGFPGGQEEMVREDGGGTRWWVDEKRQTCRSLGQR